MSEDKTKMTPERFAAIVEAYGGLPARWPDGERAAATVLMKGSPEAQRLAQEAEALDGLLDMTETAPATRELQDRILALMPAPSTDARARSPRWVSWPQWIPAAAVTCSLVLGVVVGAQLPRLMGLDDETLALEAVASALTASSSDAELSGGSE